MQRGANATKTGVEKAGNVIKKGAEKVGNVVNRTPVLKQINQLKNRSIRKLDQATELMFKRTNPKLYEAFTKNGSKLQTMQKNIATKHLPKLETTAKKITDVNAKIAEIEATFARKIGGNMKDLDQLIGRVEANLSKVKSPTLKIK